MLKIRFAGSRKLKSTNWKLKAAHSGRTPTYPDTGKLYNISTSSCFYRVCVFDLDYDHRILTADLGTKNMQHNLEKKHWKVENIVAYYAEM